jgi:hypothetical protein
MRTVLSITVLMAASSFSAYGQQPASSPASGVAQSSIGFATVAEALTALQARPGVRIETTKPDAWVIVNEPGDVQWSFTPSSHAAYPAVVRRAIKINAQGDVYIEMTSLCQAEKGHCDKLLEEFTELNERIRQSVRSRIQQGQQR